MSEFSTPPINGNYLGPQMTLNDTVGIWEWGLAVLLVIWFVLFRARCTRRIYYQQIKSKLSQADCIYCWGNFGKSILQVHGPFFTSTWTFFRKEWLLNKYFTSHFFFAALPLDKGSNSMEVKQKSSSINIIVFRLKHLSPTFLVGYM